jgi:hypothetical protein
MRETENRAWAVTVRVATAEPQDATDSPVPNWDDVGLSTARVSKGRLRLQPRNALSIR